MNKPRKDLKFLLPLLAAIILIFGILLGFQLKDIGQKKQMAYSNYHDNSLNQILRLIQFKYVDSVDLVEVKQEAVKEILEHLDPHSVFIPKDRLQGVEEDLHGSFYGIGISYFIVRDTITVSRVIKGGPAEKAGLQIGDQIIKQGDSLLAGVSIGFQEANRILKGSKNSVADLEIWRNGAPQQVRIKRGNVPLKSVGAAYMIRPEIAYIKIKNFSAHTYAEFMDAATKLKEENDLKKIILDLRNNAGGYLESAVHIADEFLDGEKEIVSIRGDKYKTIDFKGERDGEFETIPLAVLVNEGSASASEALAGAVQDWDRGYLIGRPTFGKGLVQEQYNLSGGGALRLTVGRYYLPSGRLIQRPYKHRVEAYKDDILNRYAHGEFLNRDSIHLLDSTPYFTKRLDRRVFAGNGIMPDIFVPVDTMNLSSFSNKIYHQHVLFTFAHRYLQSHKAEVDTGDLNRFLQSDLPEDILPLLFDYIEKQGYPLSSLNPKEEDLIEVHLKAFMASEIWGEEGYERAVNFENKEVKEALSILEKDPGLENLD